MNDSLLQIGVVTRPHGVRGELKVKLHNEASSALSEADSLLVETADGRRAPRRVESVRGGAKGVILALEGVLSMDDAEALRGARLWVERSQLEALEEGEYYLVDLVGCEVHFEDRVLAKVEAVRPDPTVDTMILQMADGSRAELPIVDAWVGPVDIAARRVQLLSTDGLIEGG